MTRATLPETHYRPIRAAVFTTVDAARSAVSRLLLVGFTKNHITVICSDDTKERYFREFEHQEKAGANTAAAAATGSAIGATLGSLATGAVGIALGGVPLIVAGGIGLMAGAVWGGFIGAMMTRGIEKKLLTSTTRKCRPEGCWLPSNKTIRMRIPRLTRLNVFCQKPARRHCRWRKAKLPLAEG